MRLRPVQPRLRLAWPALRARLAQLTACHLAALTAMSLQPLQPRLVQTRLAWAALRARLAQLTLRARLAQLTAR